MAAPGGRQLSIVERTRNSGSIVRHAADALEPDRPHVGDRSAAITRLLQTMSA